MKKYYVIILCALFFTACGPEKEVDISYQLSADVDVSTIVNGMKDASNNEYYTRNGKDPVHLNFLVYDEYGELVYETVKKLDNFFEKTSFSTGLIQGNYTVVVWACTFYENRPTWVSEGKGTLNKLELKLNTDMDANSEPVLGVSKTSLNLNSKKDIDIEVPTVGCFFSICIRYTPATTTFKYIVLFGDFDSDSYTVNTGKSNFVTDNERWVWNSLFVVDKQYSGVYWCYFTLPMNQYCIWGSYEENGNITIINDFSFKAEAGKHQIINVDIDTGNTTTTPVRSPALYESDGRQQVFEVGKMKSEPARVSSKSFNLLRK